MTGQTIGPVGSSAMYKGDEYKALFEVAKNWAGNSGASWGSNGVVTLPDMRGRVIAAPDNMGGTSKDAITATQADTLGGVFGTQARPITASQLPRHKHSLTSNGAFDAKHHTRTGHPQSGVRKLFQHRDSTKERGSKPVHQDDAVETAISRK